MTEIEDYCRMFARLRRAPGRSFTENTKNQAPHKPFLLFSLIDMITRGSLTSSTISIAGDMDELNELFTDYWQSLFPVDQKSSIAFPFARLHNEPFWNLLTISGNPATPAEISNIGNVTQLRRIAIGAQMDNALFDLLSVPNSRGILVDVLLASCFSEDAQSAIREVIGIHSEAEEYRRALTRVARENKDISDVIAASTYRVAARDQGFRRAIVVNYDHRCALCGVRIITPEGQTAVDAAHIVPWSVSQNDDIRNGMVLCKLCHWAFDRGMMSVSDAYSVLLSRHLAKDTNAAGLLGVLEGRNLIKPNEMEAWPLQENLRWHRHNHGFSSRN